ncbi:MAG: exodeoxyribonuclease VII large subunit [Candidatus Aenigmarchaeota archaeon]|nr:exodeoxyribonuclease VII large subunit [Candidatus Aenigmarchaeota archaeon]NIO45057.1 exodeoxyribonuclease VII large subunit [Candidatus Aenigmarchaeota archaeon]
MDILKISIVIAILGIIALFFITQYNKENIVKIEDLKIGQVERITGMVTSVYVSKNDHVFLKVADNTGEVTVVAFKNSNIDTAYELENGDQVSVFGRTDEYKGELEIIAKEIQKI